MGGRHSIGLGGAGKLAILGGAFFATAASAQFDPEITGKWANVRLVRYEVVGVYEDASVRFSTHAKDRPSRTLRASVKDRVDIAFVWDQLDNRIIDKAVFTKYPSSVEDIRDDDAREDCASPLLDARYEHRTFSRFQEKGFRPFAEDPDPHLILTGQASYAKAEVDLECTGARESVSIFSTGGWADFIVHPPVLLGLPQGSAGHGVTVDPEAGVILAQDGPWTFTYKPTPAD